MTFKVQELTIKVTAVDDYDTCSGVTRITGCIVASVSRTASPSYLSVLRTQLRNTINRA